MHRVGAAVHPRKAGHHRPGRRKDRRGDPRFDGGHLGTLQVRNGPMQPRLAEGDSGGSAQRQVGGHRRTRGRQKEPAGDDPLSD